MSTIRPVLTPVQKEHKTKNEISRILRDYPESDIAIYWRGDGRNKRRIPTNNDFTTLAGIHERDPNKASYKKLSKNQQRANEEKQKTDAETQRNQKLVKQSEELPVGGPHIPNSGLVAYDWGSPATKYRQRPLSAGIYSDKNNRKRIRAEGEEGEKEPMEVATSSVSEEKLREEEQTASSSTAGGNATHRVGGNFQRFDNLADTTANVPAPETVPISNAVLDKELAVGEENNMETLEEVQGVGNLNPDGTYNEDVVPPEKFGVGPDGEDTTLENPPSGNIGRQEVPNFAAEQQDKTNTANQNIANNAAVQTEALKAAQQSPVPPPVVTVNINLGGLPNMVNEMAVDENKMAVGVNKETKDILGNVNDLKKIVDKNTAAKGTEDQTTEMVIEDVNKEAEQILKDATELRKLVERNTLAKGTENQARSIRKEIEENTLNEPRRLEREKKEAEIAALRYNYQKYLDDKELTKRYLDAQAKYHLDPAVRMEAQTQIDMMEAPEREAERELRDSVTSKVHAGKLDSITLDVNQYKEEIRKKADDLSRVNSETLSATIKQLEQGANNRRFELLEAKQETDNAAHERLLKEKEAEHSRNIIAIEKAAEEKIKANDRAESARLLSVQNAESLAKVKKDAAEEILKVKADAAQKIKEENRLAEQKVREEQRKLIDKERDIKLLEAQRVANLDIDKRQNEADKKTALLEETIKRQLLEAEQGHMKRGDLQKEAEIKELKDKLVVAERGRAGKFNTPDGFSPRTSSKSLRDIIDDLVKNRSALSSDNNIQSIKKGRKKLSKSAAKKLIRKKISKYRAKQIDAEI